MTRTVLLGDIADINPESIGKNYQFGSILYLDTSSVTENSFSELQAFALKDAPSRAKRIIRDGDIVYSTVRPNLKHFGYIKVPENNTVASTGFAVIRAKDGVDSKYLYYWLTSDERTKYLTSIADSQTSTFPAFNPSVLGKLKIELPSLETQKKIADILGTIDEKIELNRKMNETLEQMGQALFRHYFIDNPEVEKWDKRELGEFFPIKTGKKDANFGTEDGEFPFFTCAQAISKAPNYSFDAHAILLAGNGDFNLKLYRGKFEAYQRTYVLVPSDERLVGLLYFLMKMKLSEITGGSRGSVIKFITKGMIENYKCALPGDAKLIEMAEVFNQLTINIEENVIQTQTLTALRDTLLPRLISGKTNV